MLYKQTQQCKSYLYNSFHVI